MADHNIHTDLPSISDDVPPGMMGIGGVLLRVMAAEDKSLEKLDPPKTAVPEPPADLSRDQKFWSYLLANCAAGIRAIGYLILCLAIAFVLVVGAIVVLRRSAPDAPTGPDRQKGTRPSMQIFGVTEKNAWTDAESSGDALDVPQADVLLATFDRAHVCAMHTHRIGERLLRESGVFAKALDRTPELRL